MKKTAVLLVLALVICLITPLMAQQQDKIDENTVYSVLKSANRDLTPDDVNVRMIKRLSDRVKVNLDYKGSNAVLYLKWRKVRNLYRWWFERDFETSLVIFSKTYSSVRQDSQLVDEESAAEAPAPKVKTTKKEEKPEQESTPQPDPKVQKPEVKIKKEKIAEPKPEVEKKTEVSEKAAEKEQTPEPEKKAVSEKPVDKVKKEEKKVVVKEEKVVVPAPQPEKAELKETKPEDKPQPDKAESTVEKEIAETPPETTPKAEAAPEIKKETAIETTKPQTPDTPVEKPQVKPEEKSRPEAAPKSEEPVEESKATIVRKDSRLVDSNIRPVLQPEPEPEETIEELPVAEPSPKEEPTFVSAEMATGADATPRQFIATLLMTVGKGIQEKYPLFLLRQDEMTESVKSEDYARGKELWMKQMDSVYQKLKGAQRIAIERVILQKPQTKDIERDTIQNLETRVLEVEQVYTYVRISLNVDGNRAFLTIGGLMKTPGGWRIGGRLDYLDDLALQ